MDLGLNGRVALVTGASHGIGKAIVMNFAEEGIYVFACARSMDRLAQIQIETREIGRAARPMQVNVLNPAQVKKVFDEHVATLDILVNCIGGAEKFGDFFNLTDEDWLDAFNLNLMSMVRFCREAIPFLRKSRFARIINISALSAHQPGNYNPHYIASKAAILGVSKYLANILAKDNILVNTICPSTLKGGGWDRNVQDRAQRDGIREDLAEKLMEEEESRKTPLGRIGTPEDVANLAVFLCSKKNNYMTGSVFDVDGGICRSIL